jgi:predicted RNA-binding protein Jag
MGKVISLLLTTLIALPVFGEVIDRIVAVVDKHIVTLSDIRAERTMRQVLGEPTPENDGELLDELIDQHIIHTQLDLFTHADPSEAEINERLSEIQNYQGLSRDVVREAVREHLRRELFVNEKFRQFTSPTEDEIRGYYETVFLPAARARGLSPLPSQQDVEALIRRNVIEEKIATQVKAWLQQMRKTMNVEIFR